MAKTIVHNGIKKVFGAVTVDSVAPHKFKKGILSAQLRQTVDTIYPSSRVGNSEADMLFNEADFNIADGKSFTSERVTWVNVPAGTKKADVEKMLKQHKNAGLMRKISYNIMDVLTEEQKQAITSEIRTIEEFQESLRVRDGQGNDIDGEPQYRQYFFKTNFVDDAEYRDIFAGRTNVNTKEELEA